VGVQEEARQDVEVKEDEEKSLLVA